MICEQFFLITLIHRGNEYKGLHYYDEIYILLFTLFILTVNMILKYIHLKTVQYFEYTDSHKINLYF